MKPNQAIEVRSVDGAFFDMLRWGRYGWMHHRIRNGLWTKQVLAGIATEQRVIFIRKWIGRWFPSFRRFILWHEYQHFRIRRRWGRKSFKAFIITLAHDVSGVLMYPLWYIIIHIPRPKSFGPLSHAKLGRKREPAFGWLSPKATIGAQWKDVSKTGKQPKTTGASPPENREI